MLNKKLEKVSYANKDYGKIKRHFITFYEHFSKFGEKVDKLGISSSKRCENKFSFKFLDINFSIEISFVNIKNENKGRVTFSKVYLEDGVEKNEKIGTEFFIDKRGNMYDGDNFGMHVSESYSIEEVVVKWLNEYLESVSE